MRLDKGNFSFEISDVIISPMVTHLFYTLKNSK